MKTRSVLLGGFGGNYIEQGPKNLKDVYQDVFSFIPRMARLADFAQAILLQFQCRVLEPQATLAYLGLCGS